EARRESLGLLLRIRIVVDLALGLLDDRRDDDVVRAEEFHLREDLLLRAGADRQHRDHRRHTEQDAERREARAQLVVRNGFRRRAGAEGDVREQRADARRSRRVRSDRRRHAQPLGFATGAGVAGGCFAAGCFAAGCFVIGAPDCVAVAPGCFTTGSETPLAVSPLVPGVTGFSPAMTSVLIPDLSLGAVSSTRSSAARPRRTTISLSLAAPVSIICRTTPRPSFLYTYE